MESDSESSDANVWDFRLARKFSHAFNSSFESESEFATELDVPDLARYDPRSDVPKNLGDFDRLFIFLGKPLDIPPPTVRRLSTSSSLSAGTLGQSTPPTSAQEDNELDDLEIWDLKKEVRWEDERCRRSLCNKDWCPTEDTIGRVALAPTRTLAVEPFTHSNGFGTGNKGILGTPQELSTFAKSYKPSSILSSRKLPVDRASVRLFQPVSPQPIPLKRYFDHNIIRPLHILTPEEQNTQLLEKLAMNFPNEATQISRCPPLGDTMPGGIHIFVDLSNIIIGFANKLKLERKFSEEARVRQPPLAFRSLAHILERGRGVARRVVLGSMIFKADSQEKQPSFLADAKLLEYEVNILARVAKPRQTTKPRKAKRGTGYGFVTSGYSSASECTTARLVMQEQGVDEILHMKILESLVDNEKPSTIVLASGDAAEAEYSGGFLKMVERALQKNWKVEIVAWSSGLSFEYRRRDFLKKWEGKLKIINLDTYCEEMLAMYANVSGNTGLLCMDAAGSNTITNTDEAA
ncbi:hypothetical protein MBM_03041 [Drepanopeziza brunnea f. sp. 'multigermtubi' MB_m1]|uniref:NYN domain-containing protein n=1 Tax=Marssonina brunnea f. sp. multigermtubi (strain MB_m1) TaxID=1072389 RepID=K1Y0Y8_MARBU|nr:uncharacterized protein MBM_03041 [Drepanopeziza brunnea f. sp. 'multigermtubi' MB_m1]EKD18799.1 hypothetical protein MBM_03041 [Drepanopeziza brunnea f. sp. 'multigermtubi' MB_m1]